MLHRKLRAASSMAVVVVAALAAVVQTGQAEDASSECVGRPNKAAPRGSHWWYRVDRSTQRRCWYLGPEQTAARGSPRIRRDTPPADVSSSETATPAPEQATAAIDAAAADDNAPAVSESVPNAVTAAKFSAVWPPVDAASVSTQADSTAANDPGMRADVSANDEDVGLAEPPEDVPLVWPALTDTDRAAAASPSGAAPGIGHLLLFVATLAAFFAVALHTLVKFRTAWFGFLGHLMPTRISPSIQPMPEPAIGAPRESDVFARWKMAAREENRRRGPHWPQDRAPDRFAKKRHAAA